MVDKAYGTVVEAINMNLREIITYLLYAGIDESSFGTVPNTVVSSTHPLRVVALILVSPIKDSAACGNDPEEQSHAINAYLT